MYKKAPNLQKLRAFAMPAVGVEPTRCCHHGILSPARLPVPSRRLIKSSSDNVINYTTQNTFCQYFF